MDRKKELKEQYKHMKPSMGVFIIRCNSNKKCYIEGTKDIKGTINGIRFRLKFGSFFIRELQKEWTEKGEDCFSIEILENLKYDKDETKTDYSEELILLRMIWEERLSQEGMKFYKK